MPIQTYVDAGELVGFVPALNAEIRVPLREIVRGARADFSRAELDMLDRMSGDTVGGVVDDVVGGKIARKMKKAIKKVAKNKLIKGIVKFAAKAVPPPMGTVVRAAQGAAKFAKALKQKPKTKAGKASKARAKKILPAVRAAAQGKISSKQLVKAAKRAKVKPAIAMDAAVVKRAALDARTNPQAAATLALASDITSTEPADQMRALEAAEDNPYQEPTTSRESYDGPLDEAPLQAEMVEDDQAPMTEDQLGPDAVQPYEMEDGESDDQESVAGYGYY